MMNLLLLKTSLMSAAYRELYAPGSGELKGLQIEILRELELRELAREPRVRERAMAFAELCEILRLSPGHTSALLSELERLGLVHTVRLRGRHRQAFRITSAGTAAVHTHYERVLAEAGAAGAVHRQRALRWLLNGT
jgi:DNA-binding transcriptional ArsR family regulator